MSRDEPLPRDLAAMLQAEREIPPPPAGAYERVQPRLHATIAAAGNSAAPSGAASGAAAIKPLVVTMLAVLGAGAVVAYLALRADPPPRAAVDPPPAASPSPSQIHAIELAPAVSPSIMAPAPSPAEVSAPEAPAVVGERQPPRHKPDERALIDEAQRCLARQATACALAAVGVHARHYPKGELAEERDAIQIQALDLAGNAAAAQERARLFVAAYPNSVYGAAIRRLLEPR